MFRLIFAATLTISTLAAGGVAHAYPPDTLAQALPQTTDRAHRRIPLLVIGAEGVGRSWAGAGSERLGALYEKEGAKPDLPDVVAGFGQQIVPCGSVQVVAPTVRIGVNAYPGKPEEWAQIGRERASRLLFGSLSAAQWETASSPRGLSLSDLQTPEQKAWFLSALPSPFDVRQFTVTEEGYGKPEPDTMKTLAPAQVRLRVVREMTWFYKRGTADSPSFSSFGRSSGGDRLPGERFWDRSGATEAGKQQSVETYQTNINDVVVTHEPNRFQKGALLFNKPPLFGKTVPLAGAKTVGALVARIAQATGLELYADRHISGLSVTVVGDGATVDTADLLKALCLALTGTVRAVPDSDGRTMYLLAASEGGSAPPRLRLAEWMGDVDALLQAEQTAFSDATRKGGFVSGVGFDANAPGAISDASMQKVEKQWRNPSGDNYGLPAIAVTDLPQAGQEKVRRDLSSRTAESEQGSYDSKTVYTQFALRTQFVTDAFGTFDGSRLDNLQGVLPGMDAATPTPPTPAKSAAPVSLPPALMQFAALQVPLASADETRTATAWAKAHGFAALYVPVALWDDAAPDAFAKIVAAAKGSGVQIYASVSLIKIAARPDEADAFATLPRSRNIFGESLPEYVKRRELSPDVRLRKENKYAAMEYAATTTGDYLDATSADVQKAVGARLQKIAAVPGIAGIVLTNTAAPGTTASENDWIEAGKVGRHLGYSDKARAAFIRQENVDPLDLLPRGDMKPNLYRENRGAEYAPFPVWANSWETKEKLTQTPVFVRGTDGIWKPRTTASAEPGKAWRKLLEQDTRENIGAIRTAAHLPQAVPVWVQASAPYPGAPVGVSPWLSADPLPPEKDAPTAYLSIAFPAGISREMFPAFAQYLPQLTRREGGKAAPYSGIVFDFGDRTLRDALEVLSGLAPVAKAK